MVDDGDNGGKSVFAVGSSGLVVRACWMRD